MRSARLRSHRQLFIHNSCRRGTNPTLESYGTWTTDPHSPIVGFVSLTGDLMKLKKVVEQPVTSGLLAGRSLQMHLIDREGNDTSPLLSINDMRRLRMVVDYEDSKIMFKDKPTERHTLPTAKKRAHDGSTYKRSV